MLHVFFKLKWKIRVSYVNFDLFVCKGIYVPLENFSIIWRRHHYRWRAANFDLCSALMAIEQWGFFSLPHLMWHGPSVYNGHIQGPVTLTPIAERLAVELSLLFLQLKSVEPGIRTPNIPLARPTLYPTLPPPRCQCGRHKHNVNPFLRHLSFCSGYRNKYHVRCQLLFWSNKTLT